MVMKALPPEYLQALKNLGLGYIADAFTSMDERLNGLALLLDARLTQSNQILTQSNQILAAILAGQGGTVPTPPNGGSGGNGTTPVIDGRLDALLDYVKKVPVFWGKASNGTTTTLVHNGQLWENNIWAGCELMIVGGMGVGQSRFIASNTAEVLTVRTAFNVAPNSTSEYVIRLRNTTKANTNSFSTGQKNVTTAGTAEQLVSTSTPVAEGYAVTILAKPGNTGVIYIGKSKVAAESTTERFDGLSAGLGLSLNVTDLNVIWVNSSVNGEGVSWIVESTS